MPTLYRDWSPTACDTRGLNLPDRQDWLVVPCMRTRDSGPLDESNFASALARLGGESETVEVHRFGHWGPGWFEVILAAPTHESAVESIESMLEDYPILCENDFSDREHDAAWEAWEAWGKCDYLRDMRRELNLSGHAFDLLNQYTCASLLLEACEARESAYFHDAECIFPNAMPSRETVAEWLLAARKQWKIDRRNEWAARGIMASMHG